MKFLVILCTVGTQIPSASWRRGIISVLWRQCVWALGMKLVSCHTSGAWNFEVAPRFLENLCYPAVNVRNFRYLPDTCQF